MNPMLFELQIQIGICKAAGAPMLQRHYVTRLRFELRADLAAPCAMLEGLVQPGSLLNGSDVFPCLVVAWAILTMQRIRNTKLRFPRGIHNLLHVRNTLVGLCK